MKHLLTILVVCGVAFAQTKSTTTAKKRYTARPVNLYDPSTLKASAPAVFKAKFVTTQGDFVVQVTRAWAPLGADRFYNLVRGKFFAGVAFYRVAHSFMAQFGVSPIPKVNAVWSSQVLIDDPVKESNKRGFISFATSGPNTRTTQMFINYVDNSRLDPMGFSPFGEVIEGMEVVDKFYEGYGLSPDAGAIEQMGKPWVDKHMPKLDLIKTAYLVPLAPPPHAAPKSTTVKTTTVKKATTAAKQ